MLGLDPHQLGLGTRRLEFLALPQVGGEGHHLAAIGDLQPLQDDAGIEAARIGKDDALEGLGHDAPLARGKTRARQRRSEEHTSELQSLMRIPYAVLCLKKYKQDLPTSHPMHTDLQNTP